PTRSPIPPIPSASGWYRGNRCACRGGATWRRGAGACRGGGAARERGAEACHESAARGTGTRHPAFRSPVVHGPVAQAVHRQVGGLILVRGRGLVVELD